MLSQIGMFSPVIIHHVTTSHNELTSKKILTNKLFHVKHCPIVPKPNTPNHDPPANSLISAQTWYTIYDYVPPMIPSRGILHTFERFSGQREA